MSFFIHKKHIKEEEEEGERKIEEEKKKDRKIEEEKEGQKKKEENRTSVSPSLTKKTPPKKKKHGETKFCFTHGSW